MSFTGQELRAHAIGNVPARILPEGGRSRWDTPRLQNKMIAPEGGKFNFWPPLLALALLRDLSSPLMRPPHSTPAALEASDLSVQCQKHLPHRRPCPWLLATNRADLKGENRWVKCSAQSFGIICRVPSLSPRTKPTLWPSCDC